MTDLSPKRVLTSADKDENKSKPSALLNAPRLQVPISSVTDKTPTPTKLLRAADEIGLFQDVELGREIGLQKGKIKSLASCFTFAGSKYPKHYAICMIINPNILLQNH